MHEPPSAKQGSIRLLHATPKPHKQSQISDVVEKCRKCHRVRGRPRDGEDWLFLSRRSRKRGVVER